jgi:hypothetical protein
VVSVPPLTEPKPGPSGSRRSSSSTRHCSCALELYELERIDFAEAYLVASAEASGAGAIASFDRSIDRVSTVQRIESTLPAAVPRTRTAAQ